MKRRKQERITTYISTLTVNFGDDQSTKSKPPSKSHNNSPPKQQHARSSTTYHTEASQQKSPGTYFQLTKSDSSNRSQETELKTEGQKNSSYHSSTTSFEELSTRNRDNSWLTNYNSRDVQQQKVKDNFSKEPRAKYEKSSPPTASKRKTYEREFKPEATTSVSLVQDNFSKESRAEYEKSSTASKRKTYEREFKPKATTSVSLVKTSDSPKTKPSSNSSSSSVTKTSTVKNSSKEINTNISTTTTTTIEEKRTALSSVKSAKVTSVKPATDYGETDWYLDILLRMQSLEMKQQNLHAQYDFLGKLAKENREDLKLSKDWARYNVDNYEVEAY